jgi:RHS repeat-associated protein
LYLGGVERYREYSASSVNNPNGTVEQERWTVQIDDIAQVDTLTVDNSVAVTIPIPLIRYQYRDHLGSATMETNESGQVISYEEYHPFGTSAYRTAKSNTDLSLKRYRFTNKERDDETGLYYFGVRYYAAWLGRWTSSDPGDFVDGLNMYVYVRNNPVNGVDELGYSTEGVSPPVEPVKPNGQPFKVGGATITSTYDGGEITLQSGGKANPVAGSVGEYTLGGNSYIALYGKDTGEFVRYGLKEEQKETIEPIDIKAISPTELSITPPDVQEANIAGVPAAVAGGLLLQSTVAFLEGTAVAAALGTAGTVVLAAAVVGLVGYGLWSAWSYITEPPPTVPVAPTAPPLGDTGLDDLGDSNPMPKSSPPPPPPLIPNEESNNEKIDISLGFLPYSELIDGDTRMRTGHLIIGIGAVGGGPKTWFHSEGNIGNPAVFKQIMPNQMKRLVFRADASFNTKTISAKRGLRGLTVAMTKLLYTQNNIVPYDAQYNNCATNCADVLRGAGFNPPNITSKHPRGLFDWFGRQ